MKIPSRKVAHKLIISLVLGGFITAGLTLVPGTAMADPQLPFPKSVCTEYVQAAPVIAGDKASNGSAISRQARVDGAGVPVIFVHGWTGRSTHTDQRKGNFSGLIDRQANGRGGMLLAKSQTFASVIGAAQQIPGAAVYTFDYSKYSSRWVSDENIGPRLSLAIQCLTKAYDNKAVLIGHSMGGLAMRYALGTSTSAGAPVSGLVSQAITFGTPNTGTTILKTADDVLDGAAKIPALNIPLLIIKAIMKSCSEKADATGDYCLGGAALDVLYTEGALAMRPGSEQIKALAPWPAQVPITALAGDIKLGGLSLFGYSSPRLLDLGDLAVNESSAVDNVADKQVIRCEYGVISKAAAGDFLLSLKTLTKGDSVERPAGLFLPAQNGAGLATPCFHNNLMRETTLTKTALQRLNTAVVSAQPLR